MERALLSVTDKTGIVPFARVLHRLGVELISTGGTAKLLRDNQIPVRDVSEITGFPEILEGRVKTIHPRIAAGILAVRAKPEHSQALTEHGIAPIQMVVVNLYEFSKFSNKPGVSREELIENIDIGGPTMIRAAAKNFQDVAVIVSPDQYESISRELEANSGTLSFATHWGLAQQAFTHTAAYDQAVSARLLHIDAEGKDLKSDELPGTLEISAPRTAALRYGENPHQKAALYALHDAGVAGAKQLHGKELSYNNLVDLDAAWQLVQEFESPAAVIIKHTNPCGCAEQPTLADAYRKAFEADPVSAFGGVLAFNRELDQETAGEVSKLFVEAIAAPAFSQEAIAVLTAKKNLRLVAVNTLHDSELVIKSISGGLLAQTADDARLDISALQVKTDRHPTALEREALIFAWTVCKHVKSNAIVYALPGQTVSVGAGQMSRVDSVKAGAMKAILPLAGTVLASDAFFPFPDGVEEAAKHGITAVIQPGGSVRDREVTEAANRLNLAMVFTGVRHFRH
ncbi:MAG: bifunctional phosphoribosylaminoimidazolecarboxamide formyltransferase/IMP cyclohydrolase [Acidobacteriaceae bacterium]|nr:bifunctional phosphoribosylaminoimidazolecarboxamide formyltransferase/IMP cyclohydrolase [Acidobacteriaceae bacterium]MBV9780305.1 bifunctional phosphoribosylaminoimidazolecarboxamide formyltransferase/IMP cyclohydrolase [Acidobacteriaceae bacterium]